MSREKGQLIVLSGPSGAGKSTVIKEFLNHRPDVHFSVSYTTRAPRPGEIDGVNYNYVSREHFEHMIANDELLEYAEYVGNYYGTSIKVIRDKIEKGVDVLLDIEVQGADKVRKLCGDAVFLFVLPPSLEELSRRLHMRNTDSEEVIAKRLEKACVECRRCIDYDYIVVNDVVAIAAAELQAILEAECCRTRNRMHIAEKFLVK